MVLRNIADIHCCEYTADKRNSVNSACVFSNLERYRQTSHPYKLNWIAYLFFLNTNKTLYKFRL